MVFIGFTMVFIGFPWIFLPKLAVCQPKVDEKCVKSASKGRCLGRQRLAARPRGRRSPAGRQRELFGLLRRLRRVPRVAEEQVRILSYRI